MGVGVGVSIFIGEVNKWLYLTDKSEVGALIVAAGEGIVAANYK